MTELVASERIIYEHPRTSISKYIEIQIRDTADRDMGVNVPKEALPISIKVFLRGTI